MKKQLLLYQKLEKFLKSLYDKIDSNFDWIHIPGAGIEKYLHLKKFKKLNLHVVKKFKANKFPIMLWPCFYLFQEN